MSRRSQCQAPTAEGATARMHRVTGRPAKILLAAVMVPGDAFGAFRPAQLGAVDCLADGLRSVRQRAGGDWDFALGGKGDEGGLAALVQDFGSDVASGPYPRPVRRLSSATAG
ncbi:hypothetical protein GCM10010211_13560 [Streptomyces albospinus]|uniref:Uncharacterized protein n=1 Tax=Streptomyces albospinus TaxID=285515 RepID=A0ABQ2URT8_9ACTN|nr:hypothetical protein [Streptomyces albospinus]GGU50518.1 hypothetical protein GCM10010211_13560 [Streptomyces albospinus]